MVHTTMQRCSTGGGPGIPPPGGEPPRALGYDQPSQNFVKYSLKQMGVQKDKQLDVKYVSENIFGTLKVKQLLLQSWDSLRLHHHVFASTSG